MVDIVRPVYGEAWASVGEKVSPTLAKIQGGWIQEMMPYQWENFLQNRQDTALLYMLQKGVPEWDASQEYIAGKSVVTYQTNLYISVLDSTNVLPTVQASWKKLNPSTSSSGLVTIAGGGTGASTASDARTNLGLGSIATSTAPASNGVVVRSAADTLVSRSITGTTNNIVVTNGDGVAGNISINAGSNVALLNTDSSWTSTGSIRLPSGSTSQQGASTPGRVRFNLETNEFHGAYSDGWKVLAKPASAEQTPITDVGNFYTSPNVEGALQEVGLKTSFVKAAILSYSDYAAASAAAATLPDGQNIESPDSDGNVHKYVVAAGSLVDLGAAETYLSGSNIASHPYWGDVPEVVGAGELSVVNAQAQALANRTQFIVEELTKPGGSIPLGGVDAYSKVREYAGNATRMRIIGKGIKGWFVRGGSSRADDGGKYLVDALGRTWVREGAEEDVFNAAHYGAIPGENISDALLKCSAALVANGGGVFKLPAGEYIIGKQIPRTSGSKVLTWESGFIEISGCTKPVKVDLSGVKLKWADGLMYGSFDPVTGAVYNPPSMPFVDYAYRSNIGYALNITNNDVVEVVGPAYIDGNKYNLNVGGRWGDIGWQVTHTGLRAIGNKSLKVSCVKSNAHALDGFLTGMDYGGSHNSPEAPVWPVLLVDCEGNYNGRLGWALVGGKRTTALGCKFNFNGRPDDFVVASNPASGIDIEAEAGWIRNVLMINCEARFNGGNGLVADSGNSADATFIDCLFVSSGSNTTYAVWTTKPNFSFIRGTIVGPVNIYQTVNSEKDKTKFKGTLFTDNSDYFAEDRPKSWDMVFYTGYTPSIFEDVEFNLSSSSLGTMQNSYIKDSNYYHGYDKSGFFLHLAGATADNFIIHDIRETQNNIPFVEIGSGDSRFKSRGLVSINTSSNMGWRYAGGKGGVYTNDLPEPKSFVSLAKSGERNDYISEVSEARIYSADNINGWTLRRGDVIHNSSPTPASWKVAVCTTAGVVGTDAVVEYYGEKATGLNASSTAAQIVAALQAAGIAA